MKHRQKRWKKKSKMSNERIKAKARKFESAVSDGLCYAGRDRYLAELGFATYGQYLTSGLWHTVRAKAIHAHGAICRLCKMPSTSIHHTRYHKKDLTGECMDHLHPICVPCHKIIEFDEIGRKLSMQQAIAKFLHHMKFSNVNGSAPEGRMKNQYRPSGSLGRTKVARQPKVKCFACGQKAQFTWRHKEFTRKICDRHFRIMSKTRDVSVVFALIKKWEEARIPRTTESRNAAQVLCMPQGFNQPVLQSANL